MKIALINGSPKPKRSGTAVILQGLKEYLPENTEVLDFYIRSSQMDKADLAQILTCDVLVFSFPVYVDSIPSHMLEWLMILEQDLKTAPSSSEKTVYTAINCGFYEGVQTDGAIKMMQHWCARAGLRWGQGLGIGAGGMLIGIDGVTMGKGPKKDMGEALNRLAQNIAALTQSDTVFTTMNVPSTVYKSEGEAGWRKAIKARGLTEKDLFAQPGLDQI